MLDIEEATAEGFDMPGLSDLTEEDARRTVLDALKREDLEYLVQNTAVRAGVVFDRKGYPSFGAVSPQVNKSPYSSGDDTLIVQVTVAVQDWDKNSPLHAARSDIAVFEEAADRAKKERIRSEKLARAAELRAQAEKLEAESRTI